MNTSKENSFANRLRQIMDESGVTQMQVATACNLSQSAISNYLKGDRRPGCDELFNIARFFDLSMEELLVGSDNTEIPKGTQSGMSAEHAETLRRVRTQLIELTATIDRLLS